MTDQTIKCPECGAEIPLTKALTGQIEKNIASKYKAEAAEREKEYQEKFNELNKQKKALEQQEQEIDKKVEEKLKAERKEIAEVERQKILSEQEETTKALKEELEEKNKKIKEANKKELQLLKQQRELEEAKENVELEVQRKLGEERKKILEEAKKAASEEQMLKMREKNDQLDAMKKRIDELKRKAELGSQEAQGEAMEEELQEYLDRSFPYDQFEEVKKGARGADVIQTVYNSSGRECGKILWESKNTKDFQKKWTEKLKSDQQDAKADIAVILSAALPKEITGFGVYDGVWVTDYKSLLGLATALRQGLLEAARQKIINTGRDSIKDHIYNYVTSQEFALHIKTIVSAYNQMKEDLESEKRSMNRIWKKREKQIQLILDNVTGMYGSIEGIVSNQKTLPEVDNLALDSIVKKEKQ
jgi:hypothetical protein